jgi:hypothetical protein
MKKFKNIKQQHLYIIAVLAILLFSSYNNNQQIYGHDFAGDESASFLALMDQMQNEMNLINTNLIANNQSLAKDHLNKITNELYTEEIKKEIAERNERIANEISSIIDETSNTIEQGNNNQDITTSVNNFNDIIGEAISIRIDPETLTNATIHALHFADLINSIDVSYATAVGTEPMNMSAMSMAGMNMDHGDSSMSDGNNNNTISLSSSSDMNMDHGDSSSSSMASMTQNKTNTTNATESITIISNTAAYQTAKELTNVAMNLFNSTIKQNIPSNATENANTIESSLQQLKDMIESKAPYNKVMGIIHGPIQTNTQEAFNLPLKTAK